MHVLASPTSLKGVLSAVEAASLLAAGLGRVDGLVAEELPIADGGDGTAEVLEAVVGGEWGTARVSDALGRPVSARFLVLSTGIAVVEAAEAIGLGRLTDDELDPLKASSRGLGELMLAALLAARPPALLVCLGGTATVDGGAGLREVIGNTLGAQRILVAYDVSNPLLGERGAARAFGPQKGATAEQVEELEQRLASMRELQPMKDVPGAGAAGGLGAMLAALGAELMPGSGLVLEMIGFRDRVESADLVVTGEGVVDRSSGEGKAPGAALAVCRELGVRCAVFGGRVDLPLEGAEMYSLTGRPDYAAEDLVELGESIARSLVRA